MAERCPSCGLQFERGESAGHFLGGMMVAIAFAEIAFALTFVLGLVLTWPSVPWLKLTIACLVVNAVVPILLYPVSLSLWAAIDLVMFRRAER